MNAEPDADPERPVPPRALRHLLLAALVGLTLYTGGVACAPTPGASPVATTQIAEPTAPAVEPPIAVVLMPRKAMTTTLPAPPAAPPRADGLPFREVEYLDARDAALGEHRLCVVDVTASWCAPCRQMEREAWPAPEVGAWLAEHAVAVQVDVDEQPELAAELDIDAMPTVIVFRDEVELDRRVGLQDATELLAWLQDVDAGRAGPALVLARAHALLQSDDVVARANAALELLLTRSSCHLGRQQGTVVTRRGDALALQHCVWLWGQAGRAVALQGSRLDALLQGMKELADRDEDARAAFEELRAGVRASVDIADPDAEAWREFTAWCTNFGRNEELRAWYEAHREPDGSVRSAVAVTSLNRLFQQEKDWDAASRLGVLPAPAGGLVVNNDIEQRLVQIGRARPKPTPEQIAAANEAREAPADKIRHDVGRMCAKAWLNGSQPRVTELSGLLLNLYDDARSRLILVEETLDAVGPKPEHATWLGEAAARGGDATKIAALRSRFAALSAPPPPLQPAASPEPVK